MLREPSQKRRDRGGKGSKRSRGGEAGEEKGSGKSREEAGGKSIGLQNKAESKKGRQKGGGEMAQLHSIHATETTCLLISAFQKTQYYRESLLMQY